MSPDQEHPQDQPVANRRLVGTLVELASGIDALYLSARATIPGAFLERLEERRQLAESTSAQIPCPLGDEIFWMAPHGWGYYRYCLEHPDGRVGITPSRHLPAIRVQPRSEFLHTLGPAGAADRFASTLAAECGEFVFTVSRLDLYADFEGWELQAEDRNRFVCRADSVRTYEVEGQLTGIEFGKRSSGTVSARIYDKTADMARTGSDWWLDVWGRTSASAGRVHRVEFEVNRKGLTEFSLLGVNETLAAAGDVWRYCTRDWLTHRAPTNDSNRCRWPISAEWSSVQTAELAQQTVGADRIRSQLRCGSMRKLMPGLTGYLVGFAVLAGTSAVDDTLDALAHHIGQDEVRRGVPFSERVRRRRLQEPIR